MFRRLALAALLLPLALAAADSPTLEDRLRALELKVELLQKENTDLRRQLPPPAHAPASPVAAPAAPAPVFALPAGHETRLAIGGFTQMQAEFGDAGDARFAGVADRIYARRARLYLAGRFDEQFEFKIEGEFGAGSSSATTGLRTQANEIYLNWSRYPAANLRLGQLKSAFGAELLAPESKGAIIERSLGAERLGDGRQLAVQVSGELFDHRLGYLVQAGNGNGPNTSANDNNKFLQTAHLDALVHDSPAGGRLLLGASALHSTDNALSKPGSAFDTVPGGALDHLFTGTRDGWGFDATWHHGPLDLTSEFLRLRYRPANRLPAASFLADSWHLTAAYFLVPARLQAAVRREHFDPNRSHPGDTTENWWLGLNYYVKGDDLKVMLDYVLGRPAGLPTDHGRLLTRFQIIY